MARPLLEEPAVCEVWRASGPFREGRLGRVQYRANEHFALIEVDIGNTQAGVLDLLIVADLETRERREVGLGAASTTPGVSGLTPARAAAFMESTEVDAPESNMAVIFVPLIYAAPVA